MRPDESVRMLTIRGSVYRDESGRPQRITGVCLDTTERWKAEESLRAAGQRLVTEAKFRELLEAAPDSVVVVDRTGKIVLINTQTEKMFGYSRDELLGHSVETLVPQHFRHDHAGQRDGFFATPRARSMDAGLEQAGLRKDGTEFPAEISLSPLKTDDGMLVYAAIRDITARRVVEQELRRSRAVLQSTFESLPGLFLVLTPDLKIISASDAYLNATMTRREDMVGRGVFEVFPDNPEDSEATGTHNVRASFGRVLQNGTADTMAIQKYDIRRPDGTFEERYWSPINCPVFGTDQQIEYLIHRVEDVTEFMRQKTQPSRRGRRASRAYGSDGSRDLSELTTSTACQPSAAGGQCRVTASQSRGGSRQSRQEHLPFDDVA